MDGLSVAAGISGLLSLGGHVLNKIQRYLSAVKHAGEEVTLLRDEIKLLLRILLNVQDLADAPVSARLTSLDLLNGPEGPLFQCQAELRNIQTTLDHACGKQETAGSRLFALRDLKWPFSKKEIEKTIGALRRHRELLNLALTADSTALSVAIEQGVTQIRHELASFRVDDQRVQILQWLSSTDPRTNHKSARKKHEQKTCEWLLKDDQFVKWRDNRGSSLWLYGIPGCGKTILAYVYQKLSKTPTNFGRSTIIESMEAHCKSMRYGLAYYYFDFSDDSKQKVSHMLSSLLCQLCSAVNNIPEDLLKLYQRCKNSREQPCVPDLMAALFCLTDEYDSTYIVLDALDECPRGEERTELLNQLEVLSGWKAINLLVTSRSEQDIKFALSPLEGMCVVPIQSGDVDPDIKHYIRIQLVEVLKLRKWPDSLKATIEETLAAKSQGMFRWADCQLDALTKCRKRDDVLMCLKNLPTTLSQTYERILTELDETDQADAHRALIWLACAKRPLSVMEVAEAAVLQPENDPPVEPESRLLDPVTDICEILGSLVTVESYDIDSDSDSYSDFDSDQSIPSITVMRLAHFSVKDYLMAKNANSNESRMRTISESAAEEFVLRGCLAYMMLGFRDVTLSGTQTTIRFGDPTLDLPTSIIIQEPTTHISAYPLLAYATGRFAGHIKAISLARRKCLDGHIVLEFFSHFEQLTSQEIGSMLALACKYGLETIVRQLLDQGANSAGCGRRGTDFGLCLYETVVEGHEGVLSLLLDHVSDIDAIPTRSGPHGVTALHAAVRTGQTAIMKTLLTRGANPSLKNGILWTALHRAVSQKNQEMVELLLQFGAAVNAVDGSLNTALHLATESWSTLPVVPGAFNIVKILLDAGADPNATNSNGNTALLNAIRYQMNDVVALLKDHGATMPSNEKLLLTAVEECERHMVDLALESGIDLALLAGTWHGARIFLAAAQAGFEDLVIGLSGNGVHINTHSADRHTALMHASKNGHELIVRFLLERSAEVNTRSWIGRTALHLAAEAGHECIVKLLLECKADVTTRDQNRQTALHLAAQYGRALVVQMLLEWKADIEATDAFGHRPLHLACFPGHELAVQALLDRNANIDAIDRRGFTALHKAIFFDQERSVQLLLERNARIDLVNNLGKNALRLR